MRPQSLLKRNSPSKLRQWYFGFCAVPDDLPWYFKLFIYKTPTHQRHTYTFCQAGPYVLFVEPTLQKINFTIKHPNDGSDYLCAEKIAKELVSHNHTVVKHSFEPSIRGKNTAFNFIPSCVSVVKVASGFASLAVTPARLLKCLLNDGAKLV
jgi:hypothetical protein